MSRAVSDPESPAKVGRLGQGVAALDRGGWSRKTNAGGMVSARKSSSWVVGAVRGTSAPSRYLRVRTSSSLSGMDRLIGVHDAAGVDGWD